MAFGPILRLDVPQKEAESLAIELAPLTKGVMGDFVRGGGLQSYPVIRYLANTRSFVEEDELEWFEKTRQDHSSVVWGIWIIEMDSRHLIGTSSLASIEYGPTGVKQATSGVLLFNPTYWGKGIASSIHKARTWYAFTALGIARIKSAVIQGNHASLKALEKSGYTYVYTERNTAFVDGNLCHQANLECLNPLEPFWSTWWGRDTPTQVHLLARKRTEAALAWAKENVTLP